MGSIVGSQPQNSINGLDDMSQYPDLVAAQEQFAEHCNNLDHPEDAMSEYARYIHEHTKKQLEKATGQTRSGTGFSTYSVQSSAETVSSTDS